MQDHETLIAKLFRLTKKNGVLAIQVPMNQNAPLHQALLRVAKSEEWGRFTAECDSLMNYRSATYYYDILAKLTNSFDVWETTYIHILDNHRALIDWYRSTGMRLYLNTLPDETARAQFEEDVLEICKREYPLQQNGKILYPFTRAFFTAYHVPDRGEHDYRG